MPDTALHDDLAAVSRLKIFFGHQSVGQNVIDGLKALAAADGISSFRFVPADSLPGDGQGYFADARSGENRQPIAKCEDFHRIVGRLRPAPPEIAFMKFCYSDIERDSDVQEIFARYCATIDSLKASLPAVTFVHVTVPLTEPTRGVRRIVNALLGREGNADAGNLRRTEFNNLMRARFAAEPLFDLARVESTDPAGRPITITVDGKTAEAMYSSYTDDSCHLNAEGARRAARELAATIARAARLD